MTDRRVVPFRRVHLEWLQERESAEGGSYSIGAEELAAIEKQNSWTVALDGTPIACGGTMMQWPGRHVAWAYMSAHAGREMAWVTKETLKRLAEVDGRVEITVRHDFLQGHRWAKLLGFQVENPPGVLMGFGPQGEDHIAYVRINKR